MTMNGAEPKGLAYAARLMLDQLTLHRDRQTDLAHRTPDLRLPCKPAGLDQ